MQYDGFSLNYLAFSDIDIDYSCSTAVLFDMPHYASLASYGICTTSKLGITLFLFMTKFYKIQGRLK